MQKIKMMLLSLALFAVVGGALAFKAKFHNTWCTTDAYFDNIAQRYYCAFTPVSGVKTTTTCAAAPVATITTDLAGTVLKVCSTLTNGLPVNSCAKVCDIQTTTKADN